MSEERYIGLTKDEVYQAFLDADKQAEIDVNRTIEPLLSEYAAELQRHPEKRYNLISRVRGYIKEAEKKPKRTHKMQAGNTRQRKSR